MKKKSKARSVIGNILFYGILIAVLAGAYFYATDQSPDKSVFGYRFYEAESGSMSPVIEKGDIIFVKMKQPEDVKVGDIVTYAANEDGSVTVTHRVIKTYKDKDGQVMLRTKGDASPEADSPVKGKQVIGTVSTHLPLIGSIIGMLQTKPYIPIGLLIIGIGMVMILRRLFRDKEQTNKSSKTHCGKERKEEKEN